MNITTFKFLLVATLIALSLSTGPALAQERKMEMDWEEDYSENYRKEKKVMRKKGNLWYGLAKQKHCAITHRKLTKGNKQPYVDYMGYRVYICSDGVRWIFNKFPKRALRQIFENGQQPLKLDLCQFCGEIKNTYKCCRDSDDTKICNDCGKHLNSPGHCVPYGFIIPVPRHGENR